MSKKKSAPAVIEHPGRVTFYVCRARRDVWDSERWRTLYERGYNKWENDHIILHKGDYMPSVQGKSDFAHARFWPSIAKVRTTFRQSGGMTPQEVEWWDIVPVHVNEPPDWIDVEPLDVRLIGQEQKALPAPEE